MRSPRTFASHQEPAISKKKELASERASSPLVFIAAEQKKAESRGEKCHAKNMMSGKANKALK
jgi:hypothetical protein